MAQRSLAAQFDGERVDAVEGVGADTVSPPRDARSADAFDGASPSPRSLLNDGDAAEVRQLQELAESLLLQLAERDVQLDTQAEHHACALARRAQLEASPAERAWRGAPAWLRVCACSAVFAGVLLIR